MNDDARDLTAARAGDAEAFARIYDRHGPIVLSICRRHGVQAAEDDAQETFMRAHRRLQDLDDPQRLRPWLYRIAANVCRERRRSERRRLEREARWSANRRVAGSAGPGGADGDAGESATVASVDEAEQLERLGEAVAGLDERERLALHFYYLDADPVRAAAETLQVSRRGYYRLLARARDRLAAQMGVL